MTNSSACRREVRWRRAKRAARVQPSVSILLAVSLSRARSSSNRTVVRAATDDALQAWRR